MAPVHNAVALRQRHVVLGWDEFHSVKHVRAVLKRHIGTWLRDATGQSRKRLAAAGSIKRVRDKRHYRHLTRRYLPAHRRYGGRQWYEYLDPAARKQTRV